MTAAARRVVRAFAAAVAVLAAPVPDAWAAPGRTAVDLAVAEAGAASGLPTRWIEAVLTAESARDPRAVSPAGAMGLMQLMPRTWAELRSRLRLGHDPFDVRDNVLAGAAYMRELLDRFGAPGFLAAYNAGPQRYAAYLEGRAKLPAETRAYLARLAPEVTGAGGLATAPVRRGPLAWTRASLFPSAQHGDVSPHGLFPLAEERAEQ